MSEDKGVRRHLLASFFSKLLVRERVHTEEDTPDGRLSRAGAFHMLVYSYTVLCNLIVWRCVRVWMRVGGCLWACGCVGAGVGVSLVVLSLVYVCLFIMLWCAQNKGAARCSLRALLGLLYTARGSNMKEGLICSTAREGVI